jgi:hypothetical protein
MMRRTLERVLEAWRNSKGVQVMLESKSNSISSPFQSPRAGRTTTNNQVTSEIHFGCSTYAQKAKRVMSRQHLFNIICHIISHNNKTLK